MAMEGTGRSVILMMPGEVGESILSRIERVFSGFDGSWRMSW